MRPPILDSASLSPFTNGAPYSFASFEDRRFHRYRTGMSPGGGEESRSFTPTPRFQETLRFAQSDNPEAHPDSDRCHFFASLEGRALRQAQDRPFDRLRTGQRLFQVYWTDGFFITCTADHPTL
jgi:hypothetical protein